MIAWHGIQQRLGVVSDGVAGPVTYGVLLGLVAVAGAPVGALARACAKHFPTHGINTIPRLADFLAQCANETGGFRVWEENLNYSAAGILRTWPTRVKTMEAAVKLAHNPEALANHVYARPKEGNTQPGDGWKYRGRGAIQLTFRNNYRAAGERLGLPFEEKPEIVAEPEYAILTALDFYKQNGVLDAIDDDDLLGARRITNLGNRNSTVMPIGWTQVEKYRRRLMLVLGG